MTPRRAGPRVLVRLIGLLVAACVLGGAADALAWSAAQDEANRQRTFARMRDDMARADRAAVDRQRRAGAAEGARTSSTGAGRDAGGGSGAAGLSGGGRTAAVVGLLSLIAQFGGRDEPAPVPPGSLRLAVPPGLPPHLVPLALGAQAGDPSAQVRWGEVLYAGFDVPRDDAQARQWFAAAASRGHPRGQAMHGHFLERGLGGPARAAEGFAWLRKAAEQGEPFALTRLGLRALVQGEGQPGFDGRPALRLLLAAAEQGEAAAQSAVALLYGGYAQVPPQPRERVRWLQAAAVQGDADAMADLADLLLAGDAPSGLAADASQARRWLEQAATQGHAPSLRRLAAYHAQGLAGLSPSAPRAVDLMRQAADLGDVSAQVQVGLALIQGQMVPPDLPRGVAYIRRAAAADDPGGLDALARLHVDGVGVPKDLARAVLLLRRAIHRSGDHPDPQTLALLEHPALQEAARSVSGMAPRP